MSVFPFLVGMALLFLGRINIGPIQQEGRHVRLAGLVLTAPFLLAVLLSLSRAATVEQNEALYYQQQSWISVAETLGSLVAFGVAYVVLMRVPLSALRPHWKTAAPPPPPELIPRVMNVEQAARYLRISEYDVLALIDEGSILATRDSHGQFTMTRQMLDDFEQREMNDKKPLI